MKFLFKLVWWPWFHWVKIIKIRGWRTALVRTPSHERMTMTPEGRKCDLTLWGYLFEWFKYFNPDPIFKPIFEPDTSTPPRKYVVIMRRRFSNGTSTDGNYPNDRGTI